MIRVVSYDIWRTLLRATPEYAQARAALIAEAIGQSNDIEAVLAAVTQTSKELDRVMNRTGEQQGFTPRLLRVCELVGAQAPSAEVAHQLQVAMADVHAANPPVLTEPDLPEVFQKLCQRKIKIAVISNTGMSEGKTLNELLHRVGLLEHISYELYSDEIGAAKPSRAIFDYLWQLACCEAGDILHVGDNRNADFNGAVACGLHARLYDPEGPRTSDSLQHHSDIFGLQLITDSP